MAFPSLPSWHGGGRGGGGADVGWGVAQPVQVQHQLQPERHLRGAVVVAPPRPQTHVQVRLLPQHVLRPGHPLKMVRTRVDEFSVLRHRLVAVLVEGDTREMCEVIRETCDITR